MAIIVKATSPSDLLKAIYKAIDDKKVETWLYDADKDFTHEPTQWKNKAWFHPKVYTGQGFNFQWLEADFREQFSQRSRRVAHYQVI